MTLAGSAGASAAGRWSQLITCNAVLAQRLKHLLRYPLLSSSYFLRTELSIQGFLPCHRVFAAAEFVVLGRDDLTAPGRGGRGGGQEHQVAFQLPCHARGASIKEKMNSLHVCSAQGLCKLQAAAHRGEQKPGGGREIRGGSPAVQMPACKAAPGGATGP